MFRDSKDFPEKTGSWDGAVGGENNETVIDFKKNKGKKGQKPKPKREWHF